MLTTRLVKSQAALRQARRSRLRAQLAGSRQPAGLARGVREPAAGVSSACPKVGREPRRRAVVDVLCSYLIGVGSLLLAGKAVAEGPDADADHPKEGQASGATVPDFSDPPRTEPPAVPGDPTKTGGSVGGPR